MLKKLSFFIFILSLFFVFKTDSANAATLGSVSDTVTNARPSGASPLSANASSVNSLSILDNGSRFLASDSAKIMRTSTSADISTGLVIASQSALRTSIYLTSANGTGNAGTDVLINNQTAIHTISFITSTSLPSGSTIILTFPGAGSNAASPSASSFSFNGLNGTTGTAIVSYRLVSGGAVTCTSIAITTTTITCTTTGGTLSPGTVTFIVGCTDANADEVTCSAKSPRLINPTKSATAGTSDVWSVGIKTQISGVDQDTGTAKIATDDSVQVQASVDSSFTFTIAGINNATLSNNGNATACTTTDTTNSGANASATLISLGSLPISSGNPPNISAQLLSVTSNGNGGYALTATSSGNLKDASIGYSIPSNTTPAAFPASAPWFGIHACGLDVNTSTWGTAASTTTRGGTAKYGWPTSTTAVTLASDTTGPILGGSDGNGLTSVEYAGAADASVPSGNYLTSIDYVATPTF